MNDIQSIGQTEIEMKIKEADTCHSMGMMREAIQVYEQILADLSENDGPIRETIGIKITQLKKEMEDQQGTECQGISEEDLSLFKKTLSSHDDIPTLFDGAAALKELGLMKEAIGEYEKLLELDFSKFDSTQYEYSPDKIICDYLDCLLVVKQPQEVVKEAYKVVYKLSLKEKKTAKIKFWLGLQLEKREHTDLAYELFQTAAEIDSSNEEFVDKLNSLKDKISSSSRYDYLIRNELVTTNQLQEALAISKKLKKSIETVLVDRFNIKKKDVGKSLSMYFGCPFRDFDMEFPVPFELINKLKKSFLLYYVWVPLGWDKSGVEILVDDPKDLRKTDHIKALMTNQRINLSVGFKEDIDKYINHFFDPRAEAATETNLNDLDEIIPDIAFEEEEEVEDDMGGLDESSSQVVKFVDQVLITAYRNNASDIHIEPSPITRKTLIRFRTDGVCHEYVQVPNTMAPAIVSRLKIMADMDIAERRLPQDGKIKLKRKGIPAFELRVSSMPTAGGYEDVVLRILANSMAHKLDDIGLNERNLGLLQKIIGRPYGLILCVGPTGSGKTTTLHAALAHVNHPGVKIWTAEDPVEITQAGLRQVQARSKIGLDFARIMRGFLRLDPDIIMIGEMRDRETASIGIEASLTGHLVFSTLHTNNAPESITRLLDMGMDPFNFADALLGILAQRLTRVLCPKCKEPYHPDTLEYNHIRDLYGDYFDERLNIPYTDDLVFYQPKGCKECNDVGYRGRMGLFELLVGDRAMKIQIIERCLVEDLREVAVRGGMTTLLQDGIHNTFLGKTDMKQVMSVCSR